MLLTPYAAMLPCCYDMPLIRCLRYDAYVAMRHAYADTPALLPVAFDTLDATPYATLLFRAIASRYCLRHGVQMPIAMLLLLLMPFRHYAILLP